MQAIIDFFTGIGETINVILDFIISLFKDLIFMIQFVGKVLLNIPGYFDWLPAELVALLVVGFGLVAIYKLLGREG